MEKKYINYSAEDFVQDIHFINWVNKGINQKEWKKFIGENPSLSTDIDTAREIVVTFRYDHKHLPEGEIYNSFKNIEAFYNQKHKYGTTIPFRKFMKYAALFVMVLAIGAVMPYVYFTKYNNRYTDLQVANSGFKEAKLILSGGEEILLKEKQTNLQFNAAGTQIRIDRDSIINYNIKSNESAMAQIIIPFGKRSNITLSDGTKVWLNAGSKLIFPQKFIGSTRKVFLKGEAYFDVFKNKDVPFIVSTDKMNVTVHGTEFNIMDNEADNVVEVVLVEGAVSLVGNGVLNSLGKEIKLIPRQKAIFNKSDNSTIIESNVSVDYNISWKEGFLQFNQESILNVFKRLSRFYNVSFVTEGRVEMNKKISGKLDLKDSLEAVMNVISDAAPITFKIEQDKIFINSKIN